MKQSPHSFAAGTLTAIIGVALGAGSVLSAQMISFSGADTNTVKNSVNWRQNTDRQYGRDNNGGEQPGINAEAYRNAHQQEVQHAAGASILNQKQLENLCEDQFNQANANARRRVRRYLLCMDNAEDGIQYDWADHPSSL